MIVSKENPVIVTLKTLLLFNLFLLILHSIVKYVHRIVIFNNPDAEIFELFILLFAFGGYFDSPSK